ncbi:hypothetical protein CPU12_03380 [Malaciobacter molluscorum LMG 25693]|uniref:RNA-binding protein (DUF448 domain) n=1 Tax=Malaciobacter molluscorum LMG 25693 TaxID=870501 RepID=A0A2G1DKH4_9BACT|nr:DUF448 domain-containing protein [Malaciobacter molluscorum]AXX91333.1 putative RNA-binding protein (DUF448 domain) [Malaciobacter molluscorum LMG 25693]PHO18914.1 hypothetical protein CPU12_03380 [Malaciobacter molluscorum LMG 25693]RXJ94335.1 hypothetical protein CRV00_07115 [Malaciobacter molluscorum]
MADLKRPLRMCIVCKARLEKKELLRLKCEDKKLKKYDDTGRSFYLCYSCTNHLNSDKLNSKENKKIQKALCFQCKNKDEYLVQLKEILTDVR